MKEATRNIAAGRKQLALTAEAKLVVAPDTSITDRSSTLDVRYFFN